MQEELGLPQSAPDTEEVTMDEQIEPGLAAGSAAAEEEDTGALPYAAVRKAMTAREKAAKERQAYYDDLTAKLAARQAGPSFSERMFQLSAAFAAPTSTRGFGGVMANVMPVLQAQAQAKREGETKRQDALSALAAAQLAQREALAEQTVDTELELYKLNRPKPARVVGNTIINGVPSVIKQDADGNITTEPLGGERTSGTSPTGKTETRGDVEGYYDESGVWKPLPSRPTQETFRPATPEEAAMYGATTGQISNLTGKFIPGAAPKPRTLSGGEQKILIQSEDVLNSATDTLGKLRQAMELNPKALEGSLTGFRKQVGSLFASDDPAYVATEELDNTLKGMALAMLKSTFPGAVTNAEREALVALQGSSDFPRPVRERIYRNAFAAAQTVAARARDRIEKTKSGYYTERTSPTKPAATGNVIRYDKTGKRI
jgi:hypothetical protein